MKRGHFELVVDKVVMYGIAGSGKTCSLNALMGVPPPDPENRNSIPLMKRPVEVMFMCVNDKKEWKVRTLEEMRDTVAEIIRSRMPKQQTEAQSSGSPASPSQQPSPTTDSQSSQPTPQKTSTSMRGMSGVLRRFERTVLLPRHPGTPGVSGSTDAAGQTVGASGEEL